jgi:Kef-type K+ transport system membrane component KefB
MLPRGEVTLIVAGIGLASGAIGPDMFGVAVMTMLLASVAAPPLLVQSFKGGSGYKKELQTSEDGDMVTLELEFPSERAADFLRRSISDAFRSEGFFIRTIEGSVRSWQIRKDELVFILKRQGAKLELQSKQQDEAFVRLMLMETLVDFQEFVDSLKSMEQPEMMGAGLLMNMFAQQSKSES